MKHAAAIIALLYLAAVALASSDVQQGTFTSNVDGVANAGDGDESSRLLETELQCLFERLLRDGPDHLSLGDRTWALYVPNEINMTASFRNLTISNLKSAKANFLSISNLLNPRIDIDVTVNVTITADHYKLWADIFLFEIVGEGKALLYFRDVDLVLTIRISGINLPTVTEVISSIAIREAESHLDNLMDGGMSSDIMNEVLSVMIPTLVELLQEPITVRMNAIVATLAGGVMEGLTILDMINIITNACS